MLHSFHCTPDNGGYLSEILRGFDLKENLLTSSIEKAKNLGIANAHFYQKDFWNEDLSGFSIIVVFGMNSIMPRLQHKLDHELKAGTKIISNVFKFPGWKIERTKDDVNLYLFK